MALKQLKSLQCLKLAGHYAGNSKSRRNNTEKRIIKQRVAALILNSD
jgi:hypothetical protein